MQHLHVTLHWNPSFSLTNRVWKFRSGLKISLKHNSSSILSLIESHLMKKYYTLALLLMISEGHRKIIIIIIINALCKDHDTLQNDAYASKLWRRSSEPFDIIAAHSLSRLDWIKGTRRKTWHHGMSVWSFRWWWSMSRFSLLFCLKKGMSVTD